jgi:hypothetical protein
MDKITDWRVICIVVAATLFLFYVIKEVRELFREKRETPVGRGEMLATIAFELLAAALVYVLLRVSPEVVPPLSRAFQWAIGILTLFVVKCIVVVVVIGSGVLAYKFKRWNQKVYAVVEGAIAVLSVVAVTASLNPGEKEFAKWATLAGLAYVIVRAQENYKGKRDESTQVGSTAGAPASAKGPVVPQPATEPRVTPPAAAPAP